MAEFASTDLGETWEMTRRLTDDEAFNHTYVRRVLNGGDDFETFWASGNALSPSQVDLYFSTRDGRVFRMPRDFAPGQAFAAPVEVTVPEPAAAVAAAAGVALLRRRT